MGCVADQDRPAVEEEAHGTGRSKGRANRVRLLSFVVYDACVLYPASVRDLLIRLARTGLFRARWTERILDECFWNIVAARPELEGELLESLEISKDRVALEVAQMAEIQVSRTASRQVLGSMTDFAFMLEAYLGGGDDLMTASLRLAEAPCGPISMERPRDVAVALLAKGQGGR